MDIVYFIYGLVQPGSAAVIYLRNIMLPIFLSTGDPVRAWEAGLAWAVEVGYWAIALFMVTMTNGLRTVMTICAVALKSANR